MKEELIKLNDYTLIQKTEAPDVTRSGYSDGLKILSQVTRTFNFLAAQVSTTTRDVTFESRGSEAGGTSAVATQTFIQNFEDMQSSREIAFMHAKLKDLGGNPPPLEEITGSLNKKGGVSSLRNTQ
ncbi:MAG TPA: hypothetical protein VHP34_08260 [Alphaproteobacteria bacterium]|nr:hypothetical protein [Alphaproteobacteria bacterium]